MEALVTVLLISLMLVGMAQLYVSGLGGRQADIEQYYADYAAESQLERLICLVKTPDEGPCTDDDTCNSCDESTTSNVVSTTSFISPDCTGCTVSWSATCTWNDSTDHSKGAIWTLEATVTTPDNYKAYKIIQANHGL